MRVVFDTNFREDDISSNAGTRRKANSTPHNTSALDELRTSGLAGMIARTTDLASNRKRVLREKLRGKPGRLPDRSELKARIKIRGQAHQPIRH